MLAELLIAAATALILTVCYSVYKSKSADLLKLLIIPLSIVFAWSGTVYYITQLGKPIEGQPETTFTYIHHIASNTTIELWTKIDGESRLYVFPFSEEAQEKLDKAKRQAKQGLPVEGKKTKNPGSGDQNTKGKFDFDIVIIKRDFIKGDSNG
jgi:hypothetical protein